jgi:hypothetical protein
LPACGRDQQRGSSRKPGMGFAAGLGASLILVLGATWWVVRR